MGWSDISGQSSNRKSSVVPLGRLTIVSPVFIYLFFVLFFYLFIFFIFFIYLFIYFLFIFFFFLSLQRYNKCKWRYPGNDKMTKHSLPEPPKEGWLRNIKGQNKHHIGIGKTRLFNYTENFTTKKWKFSDKKYGYFSYFCSKHRLWVLVRTASTRRF